MASIDRAPIGRKQLRDTPADATLVIATRLSAKDILATVTDAVRNAGEEDAFDDSLAQFEKITGVDLKKELIEALGDYISFYYKVDIQNPSSGWVGIINIENEMAFPAMLERINNGIEKFINLQGGPAKFSRQRMGQHEMVTFGDGGFTEVTWAIVDDNWYFAKTAGEIAKHLEGIEKENRLSEQEAIEQLYSFGEQAGLGAGPVAIANLNLVSLFNALRPFWNFVEDNNEPLDPDFDFRLSDLPDFEILLNGLKPNLSAIYRTENGFQIIQRQTYPGSSPGVSIAAISGLGMPYAVTQVGNFQKVKVNNNMRSLGLACHNFESVHRSWPAAYTEDADGKPLLSWRVHLLPFLGEDQLYEQFHLDEPWDSEHNQALIAKMPDVFTHPTLKLDEGKTVYLGVTGDNGVFGPPANAGGKNARGVRRMADMTDGLSNTAMIVEVNQPNAVPWTKPRDVSTDGGEVLAKTSGIRAGDEFCVIMCDGSSLTLGRMAANRLSAILGMNDGEVVGDLRD